ncbi:DHA2 family efflux MFS transporter permease subunit [Pseudonocardia eucalypti]|uniref:DHA2 family efflux MFS transporter permease subunit n=1 Tax=Pseudonocardia eucalypti TaxID=648755 RepID=A0ABP9Q2F0_9PSEU|nr:EmrB/QacA subfamily drug resistance transporter [Pseudonocardia eucalypti]
MTLTTSERPVDERTDGSTTAVAKKKDPPWGLSLAVLVAGMFMAVLDVTIVNVAVPAVQKDLGASLEDVLWIATAYTLTLGVVVPLSSWLGNRFGLTNVYLASLFGFAIGSALCGMAWNLESLIAFRVVQAVSGGILPVMTMTLLYKIVPPEKIGAAMGMYGLGIVFAPATGPVLGGYLIEHTNWRLIFYVNVPIAVLGLIAAVLVLPRFPGGARRPFDAYGFVTAAYGLFAILLAVSKAEDWDWVSYPTLILLVSGALSLALFVVIELEREHPLVDVRVFLTWQFTNSLLILPVLSISLFAMMFYVPTFLQQGQGLTALEAGLRLMPQAFVVGFLMPIAGQLYDKIGPRWLVVIGMLLTGWGSYLLSGINPDMTEADVILWTCVRACGMGLSMMPLMTAGISALPASRVDQGSAINNLTQQASAAIGLGIFTTMAVGQQAQMAADRAALMTQNRAAELPVIPMPPGMGLTPDMMGAGGDRTLAMYGLYQQTRLHVLGASYSNVFLVIAGLCVAAVILSFLLRRPPAASPGDTPVAVHAG